MRSQPGRVVKYIQIASLFGPAFITAGTIGTAIISFRATGIWTIDRNVFSDADFAPSESMDNPGNPEVTYTDI